MWRSFLWDVAIQRLHYNATVLASASQSYQYNRFARYVKGVIRRNPAWPQLRGNYAPNYNRTNPRCNAFDTASVRPPRSSGK